MNFVFLDLETSSLNFSDGAILEVAIRFDYDSAPEGEDLIDDGHGLVWQTKIKPWSMEGAQAEALQVNGYREEDWVGAPTFPEVAPTILRLLKGRVIIGHNPSFDYYFLRHELERSGLPTGDLNRRMVDTTSLIYENLFFPGHVSSVSLDSTRKFYGLPVVRPHAAGRDTRDVRFVFYMLSKNVVSPVKRLAYVVPTFRVIRGTDHLPDQRSHVMLVRERGGEALGLFGGLMVPGDENDPRLTLSRSLSESNPALGARAQEAGALRYSCSRIQVGADPARMVDFYTLNLGDIPAHELCRISDSTSCGTAEVHGKWTVPDLAHRFVDPMFSEVLPKILERVE